MSVGKTQMAKQPGFKSQLHLLAVKWALNQQVTYLSEPFLTCQWEL